MEAAVDKDRSIEDIILQKDRRGISALRPHLPAIFCEEAAQLTIKESGTVFIATGFYILHAGSPETDGPPGALILGDALEKMGFKVYYVTDRYTAPLMHCLVDDSTRVLTFPIADDPTSMKYASSLLDQFQPSLLISVERCGLNSQGSYLNIRGVDISEYNARIDHLFRLHKKTIGIGDGGGEIGMGNLAGVIPTFPSLTKNPCMTRVSSLIIASVSNWGAYGLVAGLSLLKGRCLLPSVEEERELLVRTVECGAVESFTGTKTPEVDGFSASENSRVVQDLHEILAKRMVH
jgi:hypothetical protein